MGKPDACTLPTALVPLRVGEFAALFSSSLLSVVRSPLSLRLTFAPGSAERVADLVARESECCSFFAFSLSGNVLDVGVPDSQVAVLDGLERLARDR
jgi:hypothetical protein